MRSDYELSAVGWEKIPARKPFATEEIQKMHIDHSNKLLQADKLTSELKAYNDLIKGQIKELRETALVLRNKTAAGSELINIETAMVPDFEKKVMNYINVDNDEVVMSRPLTPDERQLRENRLLIANRD